MKKLTLIIAALIISLTINAQKKQTEKGSLLIQSSIVRGNSLSGTSPYFYKSDSLINWNLGVEGGYFDRNNLAIIMGLGFGRTNDLKTFSVKLGAKYYLFYRIPLQVDFTGNLFEEHDFSPLYLGLQGGYAFFIGDNVSIEPTCRYNVSVDALHFKNYLQLSVGFSIFI